LHCVLDFQNTEFVDFLRGMAEIFFLLGHGTIIGATLRLSSPRHSTQGLDRTGATAGVLANRFRLLPTLG